MSHHDAQVQGVIVPLVTPINADEQVDVGAFQSLIDKCIEAGIDGLFVGGSAGAGPLLTDDQWRVMVEVAAEHVQDRCVLFGGVICTSTHRALERISVLEQCGYRYMAVTPTYYITLTEDEQFLTHFRTCKAATDMEMIVYNIPSCTFSMIPMAVLEKLAQEGLYQIVKESSGDKAYFQEILRLAEVHDLTVLQGNEPDIAWGLSSGAQGMVPVCANYEPQTFVAAYKAACQGNLESLQQAQARVDYIRDCLLVSPENWIAGITYGLSTLGIGRGVPVQPLLEISSEYKRAIDALSVINISEDI